MTKKINKEKMSAEIPATVRDGIEAIAKGIGVAAVELWSIFVRQCIVKGITEIFTALVLIGAGIFLATQLGYWAIIPFAAALPFCYGAIMLVGNPKYYAIQDIVEKIKALK